MCTHLAVRARALRRADLAFYRWAIAHRQRTHPEAYGRTFLEWAQLVPNLQSSIHVDSMAAYAAEYQPRQFRRRGFGGGGEAAAWRRLRGLLDRFAIVAPLARFDEALLLAHDLTGLPLLAYRRNRPKQKGGYRGTDAQACPDSIAARIRASGLSPPAPEGGAVESRTTDSGGLRRARA